MKIGAFAKQNRVGIDTIRHYIDLGLLLPQKAGKQYDFDPQCQSDFGQILFLKSLGFSLTEIKEIFIVRHLGKMTAFRQQEHYKNLFFKKARGIDGEIKKLRREKSLLETELRKMETAQPQKHWRTGVDLRWLPLLRCDRCGGPLRLKEAAVDDDRVLSGRLCCACGEEYTIADGILYVGEPYRETGSIPDILTYIRQTDGEYLRQFDKTLRWSTRQLEPDTLAGKVLLEPGCGNGFFLRQICDRLPDDAVYIAVDRDPERLRFLKEVLEKAEKKAGVLLICCDFARIPLKDRSVDVVCDISGTSNYSFDHSEFLPRVIERAFKPDASLIGSYIIFQNFAPQNRIPAGCRPNFQIGPIQNGLEKLGFACLAQEVSDTVAKGGVFEDYFSDGEKILNYCFAGKRPG